MSQLLTNYFGSPIERVEHAISALQCGHGVLLVDDEDRENEGDLIFSTDFLTTAQMALMIRECSGIVCLCLEEKKIKQLQLPQMVQDNNCVNKTAFTVTIEAKTGVTTGVSAADRVQTIKVASNPDCTPLELCRPGHVFPLKASAGGVFTRRGHTEGTIDLMKLAGLAPSGILCELTNADGTMARLPEIVDFAMRHTMVVLSIEDIVQYRLALSVKAS